MNPNHTKKTLAIIIISIICSNSLYAINTHKTDSLENRLKTANKKEKPEILNKLAKNYFSISPDKSMEYAKSALLLAKKQNNKIEQAYALKYIGIALYYQSKYEEALEYYNNSIHILKELNNEPEIAKLLNNIGAIYQELNNYEDALEYYQKSL
ncbi:MAG: tetratricopeptide repeat protein, partial [Bacteroidales bacterium]|nr:tetratricopeptide repeat protein [Bacteroidales bacterium]